MKRVIRANKRPYKISCKCGHTAVTGATALPHSMSTSAIEDWFYRYYVSKIEPIFPIDRPHTTDIKSKYNNWFIRCRGKQYYSECDYEDYCSCRDEVVHTCSQDGIACTIMRFDYGDVKQYDIIIKLTVPTKEAKSA